ncbi:hypothetical protein VNO77_25179 [Canavalia gladiata]|uniref:Uncharacterized protein n=1 Tax=Canavalia gladiata TaxID=3824 RepID=A0AAN9L7M7_CANGL
MKRAVIDILTSPLHAFNTQPLKEVYRGVDYEAIVMAIPDPYIMQYSINREKNSCLLQATPWLGGPNTEAELPFSMLTHGMSLPRAFVSAYEPGFVK